MSCDPHPGKRSARHPSERYRSVVDLVLGCERPVEGRSRMVQDGLPLEIPAGGSAYRSPPVVPVVEAPSSTDRRRVAYRFRPASHLVTGERFIILYPLPPTDVSYRVQVYLRRTPRVQAGPRKGIEHGRSVVEVQGVRDPRSRADRREGATPTPVVTSDRRRLVREVAGHTFHPRVCHERNRRHRSGRESRCQQRSRGGERGRRASRRNRSIL